MMRYATILFLFCSSSAFAQQKFIGSWEGTINVGVNLRIGFNFKADGIGGYTTTMDSPDQSAFGIPTDRTYLSADSIFTEIEKFKVIFSGKLVNDSTIKGVFHQGGDVPLQLKKVGKITAKERKQTPKPPFGYISEDVTYFNADKSIRFGATITYPAPEPGVDYVQAPKFPTVLLITGSGPQNRDEEFAGHKPFSVIADHLTKLGFQVMRVDDRGTGKTTGNFITATSADFADDVEAGIAFLKSRSQTNQSRIGLLGHSEGGMIAPMVAAKRNDIYFMVLMAGPGIPVSELMTEQNIAILRSAGLSDTVTNAYGELYKSITLTIVKAKDSAEAISKGRSVIGKWAREYEVSTRAAVGLETQQAQEKYINDLWSQLSVPWYKFFLQYDPAPALKKTKAKVLAINGDKDIQIISASNLAGIENALKKSKSPGYEIIEMPGLNHLFQTCTKCNVMEYGELEETISPKALKKIGDWLTKNVR
jgi:pimeloyl-ACP methyl ester carboxylesterase